MSVSECVARTRQQRDDERRAEDRRGEVEREEKRREREENGNNSDESGRSIQRSIHRRRGGWGDSCKRTGDKESIAVYSSNVLSFSVD